jgi:hypothetical protein
MLVLAAGLAAGCGSDDEQEGEPIPADSAAALERQLASIQDRFEFGGDACADIAGNEDPNTTAVQSIIDSLPQDVDPEVRDALEQSFERLFQLTEEQCDEQRGQETEAEPPPDVETEPETTETLPPEDEEDDEEEEEPPPAEETPEVPPETPPGQDGELPPGQGDGNSGQGGGGGALVPGEGD